jgi:hypothetical protein
MSHATIAVPVERRQDPWDLDWARFRRETRAWLTFFRLLAPGEKQTWIC